jgi:amino acid transporter
MVLTANEIALLSQPGSDGLEYNHQRIDYAPAEARKIGKYTVVALILNRTIGSGIFLVPHRVLAGTGCVGGALLLWVLGATLSLCGLYVWLECGLSMPLRRIREDDELRGVPRSGGEKNFLEFMFPSSRLRLSHIRTTCSFAIMFTLLYNLSGNAISFSIQVMVASGIYDPTTNEIPDRGTAVGIAIATLTFVVLLHTFSRRGGIFVNNAFAVVKVGLLLAIICLGIAKAAGRFPNRPEANEPAESFKTNSQVINANFTSGTFANARTDAASWSNSLMLCMYAFSGFEQPFYILAETKRPRRYFPKYTALAMGIAAVLFLAVNISYLLVVDKDLILNDTTHKRDFASLFFEELFPGNDRKAGKAMAALIAISIFGNLIVMTFTAARVKQEIAKEGILPYSLFFATSYITPYGLWQKWKAKHELADHDVEQAPTAAFLLHWITSVFLVLLTIPIKDPRMAYSALVSLYSYTIVTLLGCWVAVGLIMIKARRSVWQWQTRRRYRPWLSPVHAVLYFVATLFMLVAAFIPPHEDSPYHKNVTGFEFYVIPAIGLTAPFWGILWYWGLLIYEYCIGKRLDVTKYVYLAPDPDEPGEYVQRAETVDHTWEIITGDNMSDRFARRSSEGEEVVKQRFVATQQHAPSSDADSIFGAAHDDRTRHAPAQRMSDGF